MRNAKSPTNSSNDYHGLTSAILIATADDNVVEVDHTTSNSVVQAPPGNVVHHIPSLSSGQDEITKNEPQTQTRPPLQASGGAGSEVRSSIPGDVQTSNNPQRISMHPDLYKAAVQGDVDCLNEFLQSQDFQQLEGISQLQEVTFGDNTVLHIAATSSSHYLRQRRPTSNYVDFAKAAYNRNRSLLMARNKLMETALHCAVKAGNYKMVCLSISFAEYEYEVGEKTLLMARNMHGETVLHEAVRIGQRAIVNKLILSEPRLTGIVDAEGVSPLYLAVMTNEFEIVRVFTREEPSIVSCAGPKGQTALHAAVLEHSGITCELLDWDESLATKVDDSGSTPLHYAASAGHLDTVKLLLQPGTSAACIADENGLYPIHVAAKCGRTLVIEELIVQVPDSDELLDKEGRNFLHIAIMSGISNILFRIRRNPTFLRMLNARDYQGNTLLHLASQHGAYRVVRFLIAFNMVCSNIMNRDGLTPVDLSIKKMERGFRYRLNNSYNVLRCLLWTGALPHPRRVDHLKDDLDITAEDKKEEVEKAESATRSLGIISVLIATVTFAAVFTMPGGYIADDHMNHGTPVLSHKYAFKAFILADLLAFGLSILATALLIYAGFSIVDLNLRLICAAVSAEMIKVAAKATVCAFALATYTVLSHVNLPMSKLVCIAMFGLIPFSNPSYWSFLLLASPLMNRLGCIGLYKRHYRVETQRRVAIRTGIIFLRILLYRIIENLLLYLFIFLLALI